MNNQERAYSIIDLEVIDLGERQKLKTYRKEWKGTVIEYIANITSRCSRCVPKSRKEFKTAEELEAYVKPFRDQVNQSKK